MIKFAIIIAVGVIITGILVVPSFTEQFVNANTLKKIQFTETLTSSQDPGQGHENQQLALVLSPNQGTLYDGSLSYTSSQPVQIVILHEILKEQAKGQPTWTVDGKTMYALTTIDSGTNSGSVEFTGAALALHSTKSNPFTATVSVDGWIRGQPTEVIMQKLEIQKEEPSLKLSRANVPVTIPIHVGKYNGELVYYIITDASDNAQANIITKKQEWKVGVAPSLTNVSKSVMQDVYLFKNGISGDGIYGFQNEVFSSTPAQEQKYSAFRTVTEVSWKSGQSSEALESVDAITKAESAGRIELIHTKKVINMPQIVWPEGQMSIRNDKTFSEEAMYEGGQILDINKDNMTVTFLAHRGWGPNGTTIYQIITDATPSGPANLMGVTNAPTNANLNTNSAAMNAYQFTDGVKGSGMLGFQPGIVSHISGDKNYSPVCRINTISWDDSKNVSILETKSDIDAFQSQRKITVTLARPMNSEFIVNCPIIDPFQ